MKVFEFFLANWDFLLLIVAAVVAVVFFAFKGNKSVVMKMLYALVTEAEKAYGSGTGALKLATVISEIYPKLPGVIKLFITEETLAQWVEDALKAAKKAWAQNAALAEYIAKPGETAENPPVASENAPTHPVAATFMRDSYE